MINSTVHILFCRQMAYAVALGSLAPPALTGGAAESCYAADLPEHELRYLSTAEREQ